MKKFLFILLFLSITSVLFSQSFINKDGEECTLEIKNVQVDPGISYSFDIYITRNTSTWYTLGHLVFMTEIYYSTLVFTYNSTALSNPIVSNLSSITTGVNIDYSGADILTIDLIDGGTTVPTSEA